MDRHRLENRPSDPILERADIQPARIKEFMTKKTPSELGQRFITALSAENIDRQTKHEIHQGHPHLTAAEIDLMFLAYQKAGRPPRNLAQAKQILGIPEPKPPMKFGLVDAVLAMLAEYHTKTTIAPDLPNEGEPVPTIAALRYKVLIDDNFHFMDESHRYEFGAFTTADEAITACKYIVDRCLEHMFEPDTTAEALYEQYRNFGEDPFIMPVDRNGVRVTFSSDEYAKAQCEVLARNQ
jgi:hypothetical protein